MASVEDDILAKGSKTANIDDSIFSSLGDVDLPPLPPLPKNQTLAILTLDADLQSVLNNQTPSPGALSFLQSGALSFLQSQYYSADEIQDPAATTDRGHNFSPSVFESEVGVHMDPIAPTNGGQNSSPQVLGSGPSINAFWEPAQAEINSNGPEDPGARCGDIPGLFGISTQDPAATTDGGYNSSPPVFESGPSTWDSVRAQMDSNRQEDGGFYFHYFPNTSWKESLNSFSLSQAYMFEVFEAMQTAMTKKIKKKTNELAEPLREERWKYQKAVDDVHKQSGVLRNSFANVRRFVNTLHEKLTKFVNEIIPPKVFLFIKGILEELEEPKKILDDDISYTIRRITEACQELGSQEFPTIKLFRGYSDSVCSLVPSVLGKHKSNFMSYLTTIEKFYREVDQAIPGGKRVRQE